MTNENKTNQSKEWATSLIECTICTHEWVAVFSTECEKLECPNCSYLSEINPKED